MVPEELVVGILRRTKYFGCLSPQLVRRAMLYHTKELQGAKTRWIPVALAPTLYHTKELQGAKTKMGSHALRLQVIPYQGIAGC